jgi:hypothetical protein
MMTIQLGAQLKVHSETGFLEPEETLSPHTKKDLCNELLNLKSKSESMNMLMPWLFVQPPPLGETDEWS